MSAYIPNKYCTKLLLEYMYKREVSRDKSHASIVNTCVDLFVRVAFVVALAITQIIDWLMVIFNGAFYLLTAFCSADSRSRVAPCFIGCVFRILVFPAAQVNAFRRIFLPFMNYWAPKSPHSLVDWHNHKLREELLLPYLRGLPDNKKSHAYFLRKWAGCVVENASRWSGITGKILTLLILTLPYTFLRCCISILEITTSVVLIPITAMRCLVCCAHTSKLSNSFYNCMYELDLLFAQITAALIYTYIIAASLVESTGCYSGEEVLKIANGNFEKTLEPFHLIIRPEDLPLIQSTF